MALSEFINSDTVKMTVLPALLVIIVLFFWFRHNKPNGWTKQKRKHGRATHSRHDNLEYSSGADGGGEVYLGRRQELDDIGDEIFAKDQGDLNFTPHESYDDSVGEVQTSWEDPADIEIVKLRNDVADDGSELLFQYEDEVVPAEPLPSALVNPAAQQNAHYKQQESEAVQVDNRETEILEEELREGLMLALNVIVGNGRQLRGSSILKAITALGFTYGSMGIFHYYSSRRNSTQALFSLANMMEPGSFNLATMDTLSTPGLTLFTNITSPKEGLETFSIMLGTAKKLAESLDATVCDEGRGTLSKQGIDHIQEKILEHQRRSTLLNNPPPPP